jgi:hypothetical protein
VIGTPIRSPHWPYLIRSSAGTWHRTRRGDVANGGHDFVRTKCGRIIPLEGWGEAQEAPAFVPPAPFCERCGW